MSSETPEIEAEIMTIQLEILGGIGGRSSDRAVDIDSFNGVCKLANGNRRGELQVANQPNAG